MHSCIVAAVYTIRFHMKQNPARLTVCDEWTDEHVTRRPKSDNSTYRKCLQVTFCFNWERKEHHFYLSSRQNLREGETLEPVLHSEWFKKNKFCGSEAINDLTILVLHIVSKTLEQWYIFCRLLKRSISINTVYPAQQEIFQYNASYYAGGRLVQTVSKAITRSDREYELQLGLLYFAHVEWTRITKLQNCITLS